MYVENTLFQSDSWQRHAILARSIPPLISFPYTENELKLFRLIVEWHLASFHLKTVLSSDCLIRFEDLLEFYANLRKLRNSVTTTSFNRSLPPPPTIPMGPPTKQRLFPSTSSNLIQSFQLPIMSNNSSHRSYSSTKVYPYHTYPSSHYLLPQNTNPYVSFSNSSLQSFDFNSTTSPSPFLSSTNQVIQLKKNTYNHLLFLFSSGTKIYRKQHIIIFNNLILEIQFQIIILSMNNLIHPLIIFIYVKKQKNPVGYKSIMFLFLTLLN